MAISALARRFKLSSDSLYRHQARHLDAATRARLVAGPDLEGVDLDSLREKESQSLLANLIALRQRLYAALDLGEQYGDGGMIVRVSAQLHENFGLVGKLLGDLGAASTINFNSVLISAEYGEMRVAMVRALEPWPEAARAVARVLHSHEKKAALTIEAKAKEGLAA